MSRPSFPVREGVHDRIRAQVSEHFVREEIAETGGRRMLVKTAVVFVWVACWWLALVFVTRTLLGAAICAFALAQGIVMIGFNVMHDAVHGSYSSRRWVNQTLGYALDFIGGSQMIWRHKHNVLHHTYTNVDELDDDLASFGLLRLSPDQALRPWHRFQHLYAFPLYSLLALSWIFYIDFARLFGGRIGPYRLPKARWTEMVLFLLMKAVFFGYAVVVPLLFHPARHVLVAFVAVELVVGFTLALAFQLAHVVPATAFPRPEPGTGMFAREWAVHQIESTADFAPGSRIAHWYFGGLNLQVEHHLFPKVSHVHYPALRQIVQDECTRCSIRYTCYPTVIAAIIGHCRLLRMLGSDPQLQGIVVTTE